MPRSAEPKAEQTPEQMFEQAAKMVAKQARAMVSEVSDWKAEVQNSQELVDALRPVFNKLTKALNSLVSR